ISWIIQYILDPQRGLMFIEREIIIKSPTPEGSHNLPKSKKSNPIYHTKNYLFKRINLKNKIPPGKIVFITNNSLFCLKI
ncbi:MAG: hypothetical protein CVU14_00595, partial [Bacteroidetes bacterium HGW-Bacteroidetes-9]